MNSSAGDFADVSDESWMRLAEDAFAFWDNDEDAIYDSL